MVSVTGENLTIERVEAVARWGEEVDRLDAEVVSRLKASRSWVDRALAEDASPVYGVTTGFGPLAQVRIAPDQGVGCSRARS